MYKVVIGGKTVDELKKNLAALNAGLNAVTEFSISNGPMELEQEEDEIASDEPIPTPVKSSPVAAIPDIPTRVTRPAELANTPVAPAPTHDAKGVPWDERIHSTSKALKGDGTWRSRRGVEDSVRYAIEASLPKGPSTVAPQAQPVAAPLPVTVPPPAVVQAPVVAAPVVAQPVQTAMPTYDPIPIPSMRKPAHDLASFKATLIPTLSQLVNDGKLTQDYLNQLKAYFQVDEIWKLNDAQLAEMLDQFAQAGLVTKVR